MNLKVSLLGFVIFLAGLTWFIHDNQSDNWSFWKGKDAMFYIMFGVLVILTALLLWAVVNKILEKFFKK